MDECKHENKEFLYTNDNFFDGDETDVYYCRDCDTKVRKYIPR